MTNSSYLSSKVVPDFCDLVYVSVHAIDIYVIPLMPANTLCGILQQKFVLPQGYVAFPRCTNPTCYISLQLRCLICLLLLKGCVLLLISVVSPALVST